MANGYYGGAPNAFAGGQMFQQDLTKRRLQMNALNALIGRYGPEAADPAALATLQATEQSAQLFPHELGVAERRTAGAEANVEQFGAAAGTPETQGVAARENEQRRNIIHRAVSALRMVRDRDGDVRAALPQFGQILQRIGMPAEELQQLEEQIITNPDSLDQLEVLLQQAGGTGERGLSGGVAMRNNQTGELEWVIPTESGYRTIPGYTPATAEQGYERLAQGRERLGLGWSNLDWDKVKEYLPARQQGVQLFPTESGRVVADVVPGSPAEKELEETLRDLDISDRKFLQAYGMTSDHANVVGTNVQRAMEYLTRADAGIIIQTLRSGVRRVPGTAAYDAWDALEAIKNNVGIDELQRMRQSSPTGGAMGNVSDRDIALLTGVLGRLQVERDPQRLVEDLKSLAETYNRVVSFAARDAEAAQFRMQLRQSRQGKSFGPQPRPQPGGGAQPAAPSASSATPDYSTMSDEELVRMLTGGN